MNSFNNCVLRINVYGRQTSKMTPKKPIPGVYMLYNPYLLNVGFDEICEYKG